MNKKKFIDVEMTFYSFDDQDVILIASGQKDGDFKGTYGAGGSDVLG